MEELKGLELLALCKEICIESHKGQFRNDGIEPYSEHPIRVADSLKKIHLKCIALLHDVLEDTKESAISLMNKGVPLDVIDGVLFMTKKKGQKYEDYIRIIASFPHLAKVKVADMVDNLCSTPTEKQKAKYRKAIKLLLPEIGVKDYDL